MNIVTRRRSTITISWSPFMRFWRCKDCHALDDLGLSGIGGPMCCPECGCESIEFIIGRWKIVRPANTLISDLLAFIGVHCTPRDHFEFIER